MNIIIKSIINGKVRIETPLGDANGILICDDFSLLVGLDLQVEFDVDIPLRFGYNLFSLEEELFGFQIEGDITIINGIIDTITDEGLLCIRLRHDCLINAETFSHEIRVGLMVSIVISSEFFKITPYE